MDLQSFMKIEPSPNVEITLSLTDVDKSCFSRDFERQKYVF